MSLNTAAAVEAAAASAVNEITITDIHTHLVPASHKSLMAWGVDELLTYHYLIAELFMIAPKGLTPDAFYKLPKKAQADLVWKHVFVEHSPLSEGARGALTCLTALGVDVSDRKLDKARAFFASQKIDQYLPKILKLANLDYAVMTNDPFIEEELVYLQQDLPCPPELKAAIRMEMLLINWEKAAGMIRKQGYKAAAAGDAKSFSTAVKFLADWTKKLSPLYMAASLPPAFRYPARDMTTKVFDKVVIPAARETNLPVALMIGVNRRVNPALGWAGDGMGQADVASIQAMCVKYPDVKFMVTLLSRTNQQELCVLARKFPNLHIFGCWWFCNNPSIIEEMTRMRVELLGTSVTLQHSDSRVLEQLIYKWKHSRAVIAKVLAEKFRDQFVAGWRPTEDEIRRSVRRMLGGAFEEFRKRS